MSDPPSGTLLSHKDYEVRVTAAFIVGVASIPLIYPLGVVLGPVGLWLSISAYRRIKGSGGGLAGSRLAIAGIATSAFVCGAYVLALYLELLSFLVFGDFIPAAP